MLFKKAANIKLSDVVRLEIYQSTRSKLRVAVASVPGPMVRGHLSFVTEAHTDDGLPHTLEHLVFMGSKKYPFKGVLDVIANRCLASGTNASTDQDHTAYTLATAGANGFVKVLPIYIDHLLSPMLTSSQYLTEVHHIDGDGNDSGVVYSEMQDHESDMECRIDQERKKWFYPAGSSYASDTGGRLKNLRESCSLEKVREYHRRFYHPNNMFITVSGTVDHAELLRAIEKVEGEYLNQIPAEFPRPFQSRLPAVEPKTAKIICPSDDESVGIVEISWPGPAATDLYKLKALMVLIDYLTDTSGAPMKKDFIQVEDPFCSSVHISIMEQTDCEIIANFGGVPIDKLGKIQERFFSKTVRDHSESSAFDMDRIGFIIQQQARSFISKLENSAHSLIKDAIVGHQLYGIEGRDEYTHLEERLNELQTLERLKKEPAGFWRQLFVECFTPRCICVIGEPSEKEVEKIMEKEEQRIKTQVESLGEDGLNKKAAELEAAISENTKNKPGSDLLDELIVREIEQFALIPVETHRPEEIGSSGNLLPSLPFRTFLHKVASDFFEASILLDTNSLAEDERPFLMLWSELMFQSPALVDGQLMGYEEVAKLATRDLVSNSVSVGVAGVYDRFLCLKLRVDLPNFKMLSKWAEIFLRGIQFDPKRVLICAKKMTNKTAESKRDGNTMAHFLNTASTYNKNSNTHLFSYLALEQFHRQISVGLEEGGQDEFAKKVLAKLECVRKKVLSSVVNVHFAGDPTKLADGDWLNQQNWEFLASSPIGLECAPDYEQNWDMLGKIRAIAVGGSESAFLLQKAKFDGSWADALRTDGNGTTMETLLLVQYLCNCEGPLWNAIRGTGLAYDASIYLMPDRKSIMLSLYRCSQLVAAYEKTRETVLSILDAGTLDEAQLEAAKRSMVCELVGGQSNVKTTAMSALLATLRNVGPDFTQSLCNRIWNAPMNDVLQKGAPAIRQLFEAGKSVRSVALNPARIDEVKKGFGGVEICKIEEFQAPLPTL